MNPLISIIVPVYNVEDYLKACLDSIINQTYKNLEIILVDDGSIDESGKICDEYAAKDNRVKVIHNENRGVSHSRNCGLDIAKGEYILFIDSDDTVKNNYVFEMVKEVREKDYDLIVSNIIDVFDTESRIRIKNIEGLTGDIRKDFYKLRMLLRVPVVKLYKKSIINKYNIRFSENMKVSEDQVFNFEYYSQIKSYKFIDYSGYNYFHRKVFSLSKSFDQKAFCSQIKKLQLEKRFFENNNVINKEYIYTNSCLEIISMYIFLSDQNSGYFDFKERVLKIKKMMYGAEYYNNIKQKIALLLLKYNFIFPLYLWYSFKHYKRR